MSDAKKLCALTFDDGPSETTLALLEILKKYGCTASFFIIGNRVRTDEHREIMRKAHAQGCTLENHSMTHANLRNMTDEEIRNEFEPVQKLIFETVGEYPVFFRAPGLGVNDRIFDCIPLTFAGGSGGSADWNSKPDDDRTSDLETRIRGIKDVAADGHIILLHDCSGNHLTPEALEAVLPELIADGFEFVNLREFFKRKGQPLTPGEKIQWRDVNPQ